MNHYCKSTLHHINVAISSIVNMLEILEESDLQKRPTEHKHSIGELLEHISIICYADLLISNGATQDEMKDYYSSISLKNIFDIKVALIKNYQLLEDKYMNYTNDELQQKITSFWGVTYTRYEWLVEILAHIYHHRGQLHAMLVHCCGKDPKVPLFE